MRLVLPTDEGIAEAASLIRAGEVVAYPTETVYGLAVDPFSTAAIQKLFAVKGRNESNPVLLIAANLDQVEQVVDRISAAAQKCIDRFWPGPLGLVLPKAASVPTAVCAGGPKVCVRVTASQTARALCLAVGHPITSTSANRSGAPPARTASAIDLNGVSLCVDGGDLALSLPSTVFDPDARVIIRAGAVPASALVDE